MRIPIQAIENYLSGIANDQEKELVNQWYFSFNDQAVEVPEAEEELREKIRVRMYERLKGELFMPAPAFDHRPQKYWLLAAAIFTGILLFSGAYLFFSKNTSVKPQVSNTRPVTTTDVAPGTDKATLTLADGSVIKLDKLPNGTIAQQGATKVLQVKSGQLSYQSTAKDADVVNFNTIATPRGGQYEIMLSDGSKVWLNAASSLRFPTRFSGKERNVELNGEAYFEIAKNAAMPFHVKTSAMQVEVLGTHFNVNAYNDENATTTTLLEGSVKVSSPKSEVTLHPGQQAALNGTNTLVAVKNDVDVDQVVAWKNGMFEFASNDIETIMRQLSRWYDVQTKYEGKKPEGHFSGTIGRNLPLSKVLQILEQSDVHFKINGNEIIVSQL
ncbi:MAG: FecR domain-containing protein [Bacteroidetes bacterium]|nr:FecR domain-containing protein [Bacteroidota bacterium]